jgi:pimeloyl-ACP methyl ester carboxylesterase
VTDVADGAGTPTERFLELPGGRVHLFQGGTGEPVLFLHAAGGAGQWHEIHQRLAGRFEVFAPDHPGFGGSDEFPEVEAIDDLVYHYLDVIDRLGLRRPHVVGASFGGWIAAELAVAAPQLVGSLVLLGPAGLRIPEHPCADLFLMSPEQLAGALYHDQGKAAAMLAAEPDIDTVLAAYREQAALARFAWTPYLSNPKLARRLHRVTARTLVVCPAQDRIIPTAHGRRYAELIDGAEFTEVPDCGHAMYFERPAEFAQVVTEFLATGAELNGASR